MEASSEYDLKEELVGIVEESLRNGETNKAVDAIKNSKFAACIETLAWDLVPNIVNNLSNSNEKISLGAQDVLMALVEHASPEEMLLELIEKVEGAKNDASMLALLPAMQKTLTRMPEKRGRSLEWCLNAINHYLTSDKSEDSELEDEKEKEDEGNVDKPVQRAVMVYLALEFCYPFIEEVSLNSSKESFDKPVIVRRELQRRVLQTFLLQALSQTAASADIEDNEGVKNVTRRLAEDIVYALSNLCSDFLIFLTHMEERSITSQKLKAKDSDVPWKHINPFLYEDVVPITGLGVLYYLVLVKGVRAEFAPSVYSTLFIFQNILHVVIGMISHWNNNFVYKGLQIAKVMLERLGRPPLPFDILDNPVQRKFCFIALESVFHNGTVETARLAVDVFKIYLKSFSHKGQYLILKHLFSAVPGQGYRGFLVTQLKDSVDRSLKEHCNEEGIELFRGTSLFRLITCFCELPDDLETSVADHADHIIATLNLVRYLVLCKDSDKLGLSSHVEWFEDSLMETLGEALSKCRAKYEQDKVVILKQKENPDEYNPPPKVVGMVGEDDPLQGVETIINKLVLMDLLLTDLDKAMNNWRSYE